MTNGSKNIIIDTRSIGSSSAFRDDREIVTSITQTSADIDIDTLVPEQVIKNIEAITSHQERYQAQATTAQRLLAKLVSIFGTPEFLYFQVIFFIIWEICGHLVDLHILPPTFPQLDLREQWLDLASLFISTGVLVYENRQEKVSEDRSHLMLQLNLITEQKIAKLIALVEELRTDLPNVKNRDDEEAELMKQATDPQAILEVIHQISEPPSTDTKVQTNETSS
ncbi:DUF1003 domain-containing protein [Chamaesiphon sp. VAR_69_metabat_338]|uniref:DUF1003 domain-containing protein n=1 Tax=Chamaesiphon sp. VAR_69_metabat_338 TaxID=2964704 RepID=UPI00286D7D85|nr:DUF1003 domain-containing protein [Chamaesiphon sp. VAR_69_metabat_338]